MFSIMRSRCVLAGALSLVAGLLGCESTGSLNPREAGSASAAGKAIVVFTVSHDKNDERLFENGGNVKFFVYFRNASGGNEMPRAFSNMETASIVMTSQFQDVWGRIFVRQVDPGRYELIKWEVLQDTGVGIRVVEPRSPPQPVEFEATPGSVKYLGNIHANLGWAKNPFGISILAGATPMLRNEAARDLPLVLAEYPALTGKIAIDPLPPGPWRPVGKGGPDTGTELRWSMPPPAPPSK